MEVRASYLKMKYLILIILLLNFSAHAESFYRNSYGVKRLSSEHIKLIEECQAENNFKFFITYSLSHEPSANDFNVYAKLEIAKWNSDYGKSAVLVVDLFLKTKNRFNKNRSIKATCIFIGDNYKISKFNPVLN